MAENGNGNGAVRKVADSIYLRALSNIVSVVGVPLLGFLMVTLLTLRTDVTTLQSDIKRIDDVLILRTQLRYTSEDAKRDRESIDLRFRDIERRLESLER